MDGLKQPPPLCFTGNVLQNFKRWRQQFEIYLRASGKLEKGEIDNKTLIAILLHTIGTEAYDIYNTFTPARGDTVFSVLDKFEKHFEPIKNETFSRHLFFTREQKQGEPIDMFVTNLKK